MVLLFFPHIRSHMDISMEIMCERKGSDENVDDDEKEKRRKKKKEKIESGRNVSFVVVMNQRELERDSLVWISQ